ncbi:MAG: DUF4429 domain-containing protein [Nocardiopsaceae bacterium]|nr:DUF4429 domain-containing protein [Nocardiopsaceae bacterium]
MDDLRGDQAAWRFDGESVAISYHAGWFKDPLLKKLGQCEIPVAAIASVDFRAGTGPKRRWSLLLHLRERTDPYSAVGAALAEKSLPFRLTGPATTELVAEYHADRIAFAAEQAAEGKPDGDVPPDVATRLVPRLPLHIQTAEGTAVFDGSTLRLVWSGAIASSRKKKKRQRREFALADLARVEWAPSDGWEYGYMRVVAREEAREAPDRPRHDLSCLMYGDKKEGAAALLMAATITAYLWAGAAESLPRPAKAVEAVRGAGSESHSGAQSDWIYEQIERLGSLHAKGVLTDEEFAAKKAELLDRI